MFSSTCSVSSMMFQVLWPVVKQGFLGPGFLVSEWHLFKQGASFLVRGWGIMMRRGGGFARRVRKHQKSGGDVRAWFLIKQVSSHMY